MSTDAEAKSDVLAELATWVVKDGVGLGGLSFAVRDLALAVAWAGLPTGPLSEKAVNAALQLQLVGAAHFLATDHVELRRWLVDAGWLRRDGYGHEYHRVPAQDLAADARVAADALSALDLASWVTDVRLHHTTRRDQRRQAWQATQAQMGGNAA